ncbi:MAG: hypothetical protein IIT98_04965, partial [Kiritimatiellae bacterium]|nr:hypothetical protein [Kiritimatiellia bacterium]
QKHQTEKDLAEKREKAVRAEAERTEAERKAKAEAERVEAEHKAKEVAERRMKAEREAKEKAERAEAERRAKEEAERKAKAETEREEAERMAKEESKRKAKAAIDAKAGYVAKPDGGAVPIPTVNSTPARPAPIPETPAQPTLTVRAELNGREAKGALMQTMSGRVALPYDWPDKLTRGRSYGPYLVCYNNNGYGDYYGSFKIDDVNWNGHTNMTIRLGKTWPENIRRPAQGIQSWAF